MQLAIFDPKIGPYQVLPLWARVDLGAMTMKRCSSFGECGAPPNITGTSPSDCLLSYQDTHSSAEVQSVYSTALVDWTK